MLPLFSKHFEVEPPNVDDIQLYRKSLNSVRMQGNYSTLNMKHEVRFVLLRFLFFKMFECTDYEKIPRM